MRFRATKIERLNAQHPGLCQYVDLSLDAFARVADLRQELIEKFQLDIPASSIWKYRRRRWLPAKQRIQTFMEKSDAIAQLIGKHGDTTITRAFIVEQLEEAAHEGERVRTEVLLKEQRERAKLTLDQDKLQIALEKMENEKRKVEFEREKWQREREEVGAALRDARGQAEAAARQGQSFPAEEVLKKISTVIGVGGELEERIES